MKINFNVFFFFIIDVHELIQSLRKHNNSNGNEKHIVRLSRVNKMFASRACRKSVMVGTALDKNQQRKVIKLNQY